MMLMLPVFVAIAFLASVVQTARFFALLGFSYECSIVDSTAVTARDLSLRLIEIESKRELLASQGMALELVPIPT